MTVTKQRATTHDNTLLLEFILLIIGLYIIYNTYLFIFIYIYIYIYIIKNINNNKNIYRGIKGSEGGMRGVQWL